MSKSLLCLLLSASCISATHAIENSYLLYVKNNSNVAIEIVREDGFKMTLPPFGYLDKMEFRVHSRVANYIDNKKVCDWQVLASDERYKVVGLSYGNDSHGFPGCNVEMIQKNS